MSNFRQYSRQDWTNPATIENIKVGALQRIADAVEKLTVSRDDLEHAKKRVEESRDYYRGRVKTLERSNAALRGHLKRLKQRPPA